MCGVSVLKSAKRYFFFFLKDYTKKSEKYRISRIELYTFIRTLQMTHLIFDMLLYTNGISE